MPSVTPTWVDTDPGGGILAVRDGASSLVGANRQHQGWGGPLRK